MKTTWKSYLGIGGMVLIVALTLLVLSFFGFNAGIIGSLDKYLNIIFLSDNDLNLFRHFVENRKNFLELPFTPFLSSLNKYWFYLVMAGLFWFIFTWIFLTPRKCFFGKGGNRILWFMIVYLFSSSLIFFLITNVDLLRAEEMLFFGINSNFLVLLVFIILLPLVSFWELYKLKRKKFFSLFFIFYCILVLFVFNTVTTPFLYFISSLGIFSSGLTEPVISLGILKPFVITILNLFFLLVVLLKTRELSQFLARKHFKIILKKFGLILLLIALMLGLKEIYRADYLKYLDRQKVVQSEFEDFYEKHKTDKNTFTTTLLRNEIFVHRDNCFMPTAAQEIDYFGGMPVDDKKLMVSCDDLEYFWNQNKFLYDDATDVILQELAYYNIRHGNYVKGFRFLNSGFEEFLHLVNERNLYSVYDAHLLSAITQSTMLRAWGILDNDIKSYFRAKASLAIADRNSIIFRRAGMKMKQIGDDVYPEGSSFKYFEEIGYTENDFDNKVFSQGTVKGSLIVNDKPFTGNLELFRVGDYPLNAIFAPRGLIPVKNGEIQSVPIMVGKYRVGVRLDDYIHPEKFFDKTAISDEEIKTKYEFKALNMPDEIIVNDENLKIDLGEIQINIKEK